jgi:hypothetical protein
MSSQIAIQSDRQMPVTMGFNTLESFEFMQRTARMFAVSTMVPTVYREVIQKGYGNNITFEDNPSAVPNCMIALNMSQRMGADPLMIMQNLHVIEGRPSWSSPFIIASINSCGRFAPLRFELVKGQELDATYTTFEWENNKKKAVINKVRVSNKTCVAWTVERGTEIPKFGLEDLKANGGLYGCCKLYGVPLLESPEVSIEMAVNEGWYSKNGSKWQTIPDLMLRYRSAAFFGRLYAPELLMGLQTAEELGDVLDVVQQADGSYAMPQAMPAAAEVMPEPVSKKAAKADPAPAPKAEPAAKAAEPEKKETNQAQAPAESAPAATKTVAQSADPATGELPIADKINPGQVKYLDNKIKSLELPEPAVAQMLTRFGVKALEELDVLQFDTLKSELLAMGA